MGQRPTDDDETGSVITRALGEELRRVRDNQGLTRAQVAQRMSTEISIQTLANYEYGIRQVTIPRLVDICGALDIPVTDLLGLALQRAHIGLYSNAIQIDLRAIAEREDAEQPLRVWARNRLARDPGVGVARLEQPVLEELAVLFGLSRIEFVRYLLTFTPDATHRWGG